MADNTQMEKLISLAKRRGFIFQSAEAYGGLQGFWDFGPLGVELKNNIKKSWWKTFVQQRGDIVGQDSAIITNPKVWEQSGHVAGFQDALVECRICHKRFKLDEKKLLEEHLVDEVVNKFEKKKKAHQLLEQAKKKLMERGSYAERRSMIEMVAEMERSVLGISQDKKIFDEVSSMLEDSNIFNKTFTDEKNFNTMFKTFVGPTEDSANVAYLRPETAQNIFVNFDLVRQSQRLKVPFGIAQIGKAFRNEITPGNFIFRSREFEQMEIEYFINPQDDDKYFKQWIEDSYQWFIDLGIKKENLRLFEQPKTELAHYSKATTDIEYKFPFDKGFVELMGIANRTDYDLQAHGISYKDEEHKNGFVPYVIEPSAGVDRALLAFMLDAYTEIEGGRTTTTDSNKEQEVVLRLHKDLAPVKVAILPLSKKETVSKPAQEIAQALRQHWNIQYDDVASIGRRYRRQDEIGTPYCVTYDFDSNEDKKVTVRDRDTMAQERVAIDELVDYLAEQLG